jgi:hypothetical protein
MTEADFLFENLDFSIWFCICEFPEHFEVSALGFCIVLVGHNDCRQRFPDDGADAIPINDGACWGEIFLVDISVVAVFVYYSRVLRGEDSSFYATLFLFSEVLPDECREVFLPYLFVDTESDVILTDLDQIIERGLDTFTPPYTLRL